MTRIESCQASKEDQQEAVLETLGVWVLRGLQDGSCGSSLRVPDM